MAYWITAIGVLGVLILALNFILEASDRLGKDHYSFVILHIIASACLLTYSALENIPLFIILNAMLILVGLAQLLKIRRTKTSNP